MQQFIVPQFIDVEDKIFGPVTTRQFIILLAAGLVIFVAYKYGDFALFITTLALGGGLALIFAFVKVNGQQFHYFVLNLIQSFRRPKLRLWSKQCSKEELDFLRKQKVEEVEVKEARKPAKSEHIRDLSLIVNTGGFYQGEE